MKNGFITSGARCVKYNSRMANSVSLDIRWPLQEQVGLGVHCLIRSQELSYIE